MNNRLFRQLNIILKFSDCRFFLSPPEEENEDLWIIPLGNFGKNFMIKGNASEKFARRH